MENVVHKQKKIKIKKILQIGLSYTSGTTTIRRSLPFEIFKRLKNKYSVKVFDEFLKNNSEEVDNIKNYFEPASSNQKFDIILIFNDNNNFSLIKKFLNKNSLVIDINNFYKKDCLKHKIKYKSLEHENN